MSVSSTDLSNWLDIDECDEDREPCNSNAHCRNSIGSYKCSCNEGFTGDGIDCSGMKMLNLLSISRARNLLAISARLNTTS